MTRRSRKYIARQKSQRMTWSYIGEPTGVVCGNYRIHIQPPRINLWTGEYENEDDRYTRQLLIKPIK